MPLVISGATFAGPSAVLRHSDVVFMYQADARTYAEYGATVLAWGGKPTPQSLGQARGVKVFGSVGMVTEFAGYCKRYPETYVRGLCRDVHGQPVKVPWLTDHQHQGIPYWWCCTQQPLFRQYIRQRVADTVKAGAHGVHIDDHLGTAGGLWLGLCFCDRCVEGFRAHLRTLPADDLRRLGVAQPERYDFRAAVRAWMAADEGGKRNPTGHPLWAQWTIYQCRAAAAFMRELHDLANATAGRPVPMGANAGLLWPRHLSDYQTLDLFSAETDHQASARRCTDEPLFAYRLADAVNRPYAATASGHDWAFIKEHNLPGLVRTWIALGYAAGHGLMAPHRQWCYTPEKGTHWYQGPAAKFAPLYRFVRRHAALFDGYENAADLAVVLPHRDFLKTPHAWFHLGRQLAAANLSYRLLLAGDEIVEHPLRAADFDAAPALLIPDTAELLPADRRLVEQRTPSKRVFTRAADAVASIRPAVRVTAPAPVRVLARVKPGSAVVHFLNHHYDPAHDRVRPIQGVRVRVDVGAWGLPANTVGRWVTPEGADRAVALADGQAEMPELGLWGLLALGSPP